MDSLLNVSRRGLVKWGLAAAGLPMLTKAFGSNALAQDAGAEGGKKGAIGGRAEEELYTGKGLQGGGQLEIRLTQSIYTSDPDALEVAQRMKPFDLESWIVEWTRVAEKNEEMAEKFAGEGYKVTANEYYLKASGFYREACWPQPVDEPRMMPTYKKMRETFDKAWKMTRPPFERVQINYEGKMLDGYFRKPNGSAREEVSRGDSVPGRRHDGRSHDLGRRRLHGARHGVSGRRFSGPGRRDALARSAPASGYRPSCESHDRLSGDALRCGRHARRAAGHQHGRIRRAASRERRKENQGCVHEQRLLRPEIRPVRILSADSGARPLDHRGEGSGRCAQEAWRL